MDLSRFKRRNLGVFPTPIIGLPNLSRKLGGPEIWIKRDDLNGLAFGGNKIRKLEFLIGDALYRGFDSVVTGGAAQSNHCRQTAAAAARCGLECHLVLSGEEPDTLQGNLLLNHLLGATIHWAGEFRKGEKIPETAEILQSKGRIPYVIPYGGSNEIGALGFVDATDELLLQSHEMNINFTDIVFASSSGGTQAGMVLGTRMSQAKWNIIGIRIDKADTGNTSYRHHIEDIIDRMTMLMEVQATHLNSQLIIEEGYTGGGYAVTGDLEREATALLAQTEGIIVDPVYTARALGGLIDMIQKKQFSPKERVLFWHTGGTPAVFSYSKELLNIKDIDAQPNQSIHV